MHRLADFRLLAWIFAAVAIAIVVALLFLERDHLSVLNLSPPQAAFWDIVLKGIGGVVALGGAALALTKYFDEKVKENRTALIEAQKPFYSKRQEVYYDLVSATACIGTRDRQDQLRIEAEDKFWQLFWGVIPMITDDQVGVAINAFSIALDTPDDGILLRNKSMELARACRKSLGYIEH